jgi:hypothetical protein
MNTVHAYPATKVNGSIEPFEYELGSIGPEEVDIDVESCGICHSDLSMLEDAWGMTQFPFVEAFMDLRDYVESRTAELNPTSLIEALKAMGYAPREIAAIRQMNTVFSNGNQLYVLIATVARHLLEIGDMRGAKDTELFEGRHAPDIQVPFLLKESHHADEPTRAVYEDIKSILQLPFVNTDYRAFARWPSYFAMAWQDLREKAGSPAYETICQACHSRVAKLVATDLPNPGGLSSDALRRAAEADASLDDVIQVCRLFQWLLPGLITNVAYFRHQLEAV